MRKSTKPGSTGRLATQSHDKERHQSCGDGK